MPVAGIQTDALHCQRLGTPVVVPAQSRLVWYGALPNNCAGDMLTAKRIHGETLSPLDATVYKGKARAGQLPSDLTGRGAGVAVEEPALRATARPDPKGKYLDCMPWLPCNCGRCSSVGFNEVLI
jgi:hypothetical protein